MENHKQISILLIIGIVLFIISLSLLVFIFTQQAEMLTRLNELKKTTDHVAQGLSDNQEILDEVNGRIDDIEKTTDKVTATYLKLESNASTEHIF